MRQWLKLSHSQRRARGLQSWSTSREEVRLRFRCTGCGKCCTGSGGRVRVNDRELQELAAATDLSVAEFRRSYTRPVEEDVDGQKETQLVLKQTPDDRQCIFLRGSKCSVYQARPTQCRTFPWWPQHLVSDYDWQLAAADCEGIHVTEEEKEGEDIPVYSFDDVMPETILHDIHRSGENYTYDELQQMLSDLREVELEFVAQYKAEFFAKFSRRVVFSDDEVTVLDSLFDGSSKPTRSFVFNNRLRLTQSEVALVSMPDENSESEPEFDRTLKHDPRLVIHEEMGEEFLAKQKQVNVITESPEALKGVETKLGQVFSHGLCLSLSANTTFFLFNDMNAESTPLEVADYIRLIMVSDFQSQYAQTPGLLYKCQLTAWSSFLWGRRSERENDNA
ncbi:putative spermine/spermidine synthase [Phytophthora cinnamomi]|uniref:putative spermine/spermidine synthase n=1 Tax=Phytophthora cinnamomi TaxID=4785 RepID=UPI00355974D5|nr:putative spermine/spermidine synthase [Phytophthora cinnamomi]